MKTKSKSILSLVCLLVTVTLSSCTIPFTGKEYGIFSQTWKEERDIVVEWGVDSTTHKQWKTWHPNDWTRGKWDPSDPYGLKQK